MFSRVRSSRGFASTSRPTIAGALLPVDRSALARDIASAGALGVTGDVVCQFFIERRSWQHSDPAQRFDVRRAVALGAFGCAYLGTFVHFLYKTYSPIVLTVASRLPAGGVRGALLHSESASHSFACALADNLHCGTVYIPSFYLAAGVMQGESLSDSASTLRREWLLTYATCSTYWVPFMACVFKFVPPSGRVRVVAAANLVWSTIIDFIAHRGHDDCERTGLSREQSPRDVV